MGVDCHQPASPLVTLDHKAHLLPRVLVIHVQLEQLQALQAEGVRIDPAVGTCLDIIVARSRHSSLSAPRCQKTLLEARAEKEGRLASLSSLGTSTDLIQTLVNVNDNAAAASPVKAEDLGPMGRSIV
jgi:hypothetical protein